MAVQRRFECLQPSRIPKPNPEASQDQAARALRSKGSRIPLPSQVYIFNGSLFKARSG